MSAILSEEVVNMCADAIANLVVAILAVLTLGEIGASTPESPNFITQLCQVFSTGN